MKPAKNAQKDCFNAKQVDWQKLDMCLLEAVK